MKLSKSQQPSHFSQNTTLYKIILKLHYKTLLQKLQNMGELDLHTCTDAMNAGLMKVTCTVLTEIVMPSITLLIKLYFALPP
jgi:hypothetical protein